METILKRWMVVGASFTGLSLLMLSAVFRWSEVPMATAGDPASVVMVEPSIALLYKLGCQVFVVLGFLIAGSRISRGNTVAAVTACWLVLLLFYPYAVTVWHPRLSSQAAWLQIQYHNLVGEGNAGELAMAAEFAQERLKTHVYSVDAPPRFCVFAVPHGYPSEFEMGHLSDLTDWLGYTEAFCQFSRVGWYLALFGTLSILVSSCLAGRPDLRRMGLVIRVIFFVGGAGVLGALGLSFAAGWHVRDAEKCARRGDCDQALHQLDRAQDLLPILEQDTYFVVQRGCLFEQLGQPDRLEARLYRATIFERDGRLAESLARYRAVLRDAPLDSPCEREACRGILRDAIHAMNSGDLERAANELREVLETDPASIEAIYLLQLACLRTGKHGEVVALNKQLDEICRRFQHPCADAVRSASQQNTYMSALDRDDLRSAVEAYQKAKVP
jgi:hypothetical protein